MKKRLLLMIIAVVCLSPSIVFADLSEKSYVGTFTTAFHQDPQTGELVSTKSSGVGIFQRAPAATGSAPANPAPMPECETARKRIRSDEKRMNRIENNLPTLYSGNSNG